VNTTRETLTLRSPFFAQFLRAGACVAAILPCGWLIWAFLTPTTVPHFSQAYPSVGWPVFLLAVLAAAGLGPVALDAVANMIAVPFKSRFLRLTSDGFEETWPFRSRFVTWQDCGVFSVAGRSPARHVAFERSTPSLDLMSGAIRDHLGLSGQKSDFVRGNYGMKPQDLADLMNRYRDAALEKQSCP